MNLIHSVMQQMVSAHKQLSRALWDFGLGTPNEFVSSDEFDEILRRIVPYTARSNHDS